MRVSRTGIQGIYIIHSFVNQDERGSFVKFYHAPAFLDDGLDFTLNEAYYSVSKKNVIRGMHFQKPPHEHDKIVYVSRGRINDVILDLREGSPTCGKSMKVELDAYAGVALFIGKGFAHGFEALENHTTIHYLLSSVYAPAHDAGILWNSFGHEWQTRNPLMSVRDRQHISFEDYLKSDSKFFYHDK